MNKKKRIPKFLRALREPRPPAAIASVFSMEQLDISKEVAYILKRARAGDSRVIGLGKLIFFSTETRTAWMLDWEDELAICLMQDGEPRPYQLGETAKQFQIQWQGRYHITGELFTYIDNQSPTHARVIGGYPTAEITQTIERLRGTV